MATRLTVFERFGVRRFPEGTRTAADAARAIGCSVDQIVKSLVFVAAGEPLIVLMSGRNRVDAHKLGACAGEPVVKADAARAREATGFSIGGVPPFGHRTRMPVYIDADLLEYEVVWCAAGRPDAVFPIQPAELVKASRGTVADLRE